jgi:glycosyltransferase involved in cell wall biosynthesis
MNSSLPIRILHVFGKLNTNGAETMVINLYRKLDRTQIQFDFIVHTHEDCYYDQEILELGGKIHRIERFTGKNLFRYISAWKQFFALHPEYLIVHSHVRSTAALLLKAAKSAGRVTIAHSHSISNGTGLDAIVKKIFQYPIRHIGDFLFACSTPAGKWLYGEKTFQNGKGIVLKNAINLGKFIFNHDTRKEYREQLNLTNKFVIGHVGRFDYPKNHIFLLDIFAEIYKQNQNTVLLLVGVGDLMSAMKEKVEALGLKEAVRFLGARNDVPELMQAIDVFLFPSLYEGLGIVAIEAQAASLPTIVSDQVPSEIQVTELVQFLPLKRSALDWANVVLENQQADRNKRTQYELAEAGYDIDQSVKLIENFYLSLLT